MSPIILPASIISICILVYFPHVSHMDPLISHSVFVWGGWALPLA